jgi:hypothetical protein
VLTWIGGVIAALGTILGVVGTIFSVVAAIIGAICTPIGLVIAAVAALGAALLYFTGAGSKALSWLGEKFGGLKDDAVDSYNGICDALASGNIGLAARIVWLTLKMWWSKGVAWISGIWNDCMGWLTRTFFEAVGGWRIIFEQIGHGLTVAWIATTKFLSDIWYNFVYGIQVAWAWCGMMLQKAWNKIKGVFTNFDADAANRAAQEAYQAKVNSLKNEKDAKVRAAAEQYDRDRAAESELNRKNLQDIVDQTEAKINADRAAREATAAGHEKEVEDAKAAWRDSLAQAKTEREAKDKAKKNDEAPALLDRSKTALSAVPAVGQGPARGTFNARAILGLEIGNNGQRLVNATETTARNTGQIAKQMTGGAKFK